MSFRSFSSIATRCSSSFSWLVNVIIFSSFSLVSVLLKREKKCQGTEVLHVCFHKLCHGSYHDSQARDVDQLTEWTLKTRLKIIKRIKFRLYTIFNVVTGTQQRNNFSVTYGNSLSAILLALNFSKYHNTECGCGHRFSCYVQR